MHVHATESGTLYAQRGRPQHRLAKLDLIRTKDWLRFATSLFTPVCRRQLVVGHGVGVRVEAVEVAQQETQREAQLAIRVRRLQIEKR